MMMYFNQIHHSVITVVILSLLSTVVEPIIVMTMIFIMNLAIIIISNINVIAQTIIGIEAFLPGLTANIFLICLFFGKQAYTQ